MRITNVKVHKLGNDGNVKAVASITFDECFAVTGLKVVEGKNGLFVSMPRYKNTSGEYKDICFPIEKSTRDAIRDAVVSAYKGEGVKNTSQPEQQAKQLNIELDDDDDVPPF